MMFDLLLSRGDLPPVRPASTVEAPLPSGQAEEHDSGSTRMDWARRPRIVPAMTRRRRSLPLALVLTAVLAAGGCATGDAPPPAGVRPDGFPTGVFVKSFVDPDLGPLRLYWIFDADGDWAEVPEATAGQTISNTGPARGHYRVDGDLVSITLEAPPFWGDHEHRWRLEGDRLITTYEDSEFPEDADFFRMLDGRPWVRVP
jgi:hypothetical protein